MSFLGGVRWADLSSDTQSLSAAPPFCPDLDDDAPAPSPPGAAPSPRSTAFRGQSRKNKGRNNACDTADALLLQCDAAAEQSYLNPSCAADLGSSNAGINLHFREAARLGSTTSVDEDMGEAEDSLEPSHVHEDAANTSPNAGFDASRAVLAAERGRGQRLSNNAQHERGGQASLITSNRRGRGYASGGGPFCAGFKGLLASTNSATPGSDGAAACSRKKRDGTDNSGSYAGGSCTAVSSQHSGAAQGKRFVHGKVQERTETQRSLGPSWPPARKSGGDHIRTGDRRGGMHSSALTSAAMVKVHQNICEEEDTSPGGRRKTGESKVTGRRRDLAKGDQLPAVNASGDRATEEQRDSGPDASDNWRSSPTKGRGGFSTAALPEQCASSLRSGAAASTLKSHEPQSDDRLASSGVLGGDVSVLKEQSEQVLPCFDQCAQERSVQQQERRVSAERLVRESRTEKSQQHRALVSSNACVRESREKTGRRAFPLATRMMTPAKRHRPPVGREGQEGSGTPLHSNGAFDTTSRPTEHGDNSSASGDMESGMEDARAVENASDVKEARYHLPSDLMQHSRASQVEGYNALRATTSGASETDAADPEEASASTPQSQVPQGPPPRKKKRGETETSKRLSVEDMTIEGVSTQSRDAVAAAGAADALKPEAVPVIHASSGDNFLCGGRQHRRGKRVSLRGAGSATTVRGRRRSKATTDGKRGERAAHEHDSVHRFPEGHSQDVEGATGTPIGGPSLLQVAAQACPLLQLPGGCFATPPYIMVPVAAATPLTTIRRSSGGSVIPPAAVHPTSVVCGSTVAGKKPQQHQKHKPVTVAAPSPQTNLNDAAHQDDEETEQEWARRASARMKDIAVGKATEGYRNFIRIIPKDNRRAGDPATPDPKQRCSKAKFQRELLDWRRQLHRYDGCCPTEEYHILPGTSCSSGGAAPEWTNASIPCSANSSVVQDPRCKEEHCDTSSCNDGKYSENISSAVGSSTVTVLFSTPGGGSGQAAGETAGLETLTDPIEQFNRECERTWL